MSATNLSDGLLIVSALKLERDAVLKRLRDVTECMVANFPAHVGMIDGRKVTVVCLHGMGNINAAAKTALTLERVPASLVVLAGIAGGIKSRTTELFSAQGHLLGDVLVAEQVIDYESGKQRPGGLERRPRAMPSSPQLLAAARETSLADWVHSISVERPDGAGNRVMPQLHFGTVGSGEKVITDPAFVDPLMQVWTQLIGVEMEGLGVAIACHQRQPAPGFIMVKGICDWADPEKNDEWQAYAADAAAAVTVAMVRRLVCQRPPECEPPQESKSIRVQASPKFQFVQRLQDGWKDLCDVIGIPAHERNRFLHGDESRAIWEWLEARQRLSELPALLDRIGRSDLKEGLTANPSNACRTVR